jgi:hypothetical protein
MNAPRLLPILAALCATPLAGCDLANDLLNSNCSDFDQQYQDDLATSAVLNETIPATPENFPMGVVLNNRAVNYLFARLAETNLPEIRESFRVLGQEVTIVIAPEIPLLAIGGNDACRECLAASVPFGIGVGFNNENPPLGGGQLDAQMPVTMLAIDNRKTALTAQFEGLTVTGLTVEIPGDLPSNVLDPAEDIAARALTSYLQTRFRSARIATFDSWELGAGEILLAGRGPFIFPEQETMLVAMQSNLPLTGAPDLQVQSAMPEGADIGFVFHPGLLLSLTRRMNYEGVVENSVNDEGNSFDGDSSNKVTLQTMESTDEQLLRTTARLWRTDSLCGTADLSASLGLSVGPGQFAFTIQDVEITGGEGFGSLLNADSWAGGQFIDSLVDTLNITINYDQIFGGEEGSPAEMGPFQFNIDSRGVSVYLNVLEGV